jgi:hypothetical protein
MQKENIDKPKITHKIKQRVYRIMHFHKGIRSRYTNNQLMYYLTDPKIIVLLIVVLIVNTWSFLLLTITAILGYVLISLCFTIIKYLLRNYYLPK